MKTTVAFPVSILFLCVVVVCGPAGAGVPSTAWSDEETSARNGLLLKRGCGCLDIASTDSFRTRGLEYVTSREFAEAIVAVASGASEYSPAEIPPSWRAVAVEWSASVGATSGRAPQRVEASASPPASEKTKLLESTETCAPVLLYLASLEYRGRIGNERIPPVFPRVTRASTRALEQGLAFRKGIRCFKD